MSDLWTVSTFETSFLTKHLHLRLLLAFLHRKTSYVVFASRWELHLQSGQTYGSDHNLSVHNVLYLMLLVIKVCFVHNSRTIRLINESSQQEMVVECRLCHEVDDTSIASPSCSLMDVRNSIREWHRLQPEVF